MTPTVNDFIPMIETQRGDPYVFGAETRFSDPDPAAFDCSELVEWGCARIGVFIPDGAINQYGWCKQHGTLLSVADGIYTRGALLFRIGTTPNHVAVSLGNGSTFEARGRLYGVNQFSAFGRSWTHAAKIPGLDYSAPVVSLKEGVMADGLTADEKRLLFEVLARLDNKGTELLFRVQNAERDAAAVRAKLGA